MFQNMKKTILNSNENLLSSTASLTDTEFRLIANKLRDLSWNSVILNAVVFPDNTNHPKNFEIVKTLKNYVNSTDYVYKIVLQTRKKNLIYDSSGVVSFLDSYANAADFASETLESFNEDYYDLIKTDDGNLCLKFGFIDGSKGFLGNFLVYLDSDKLFSFITNNDQNIYIVSSNDQPIFNSNPTNSKFPGIESFELNLSDIKKDDLQYLYSDYTHLRFIYNYSKVNLPILDFLRTNPINLFLVILTPMILVFALFTAWIFYKPLYQIIQSLNPLTIYSSELPMDDWAYLNNSISNLNYRSNQFNKLVDYVSPLLKKEFLTNLLETGTEPNEHIARILSDSFNPFPEKGKFVLFVTRNTFSGVFNSTIIEHTISRMENIKHKNVTLFSFEYRFAILTLLIFNEMPFSNIEKKIDDIKRSIIVYTQNLPNSFSSHSQQFEKISEIYNAYTQVLMLPECSTNIQDYTIASINNIISTSVNSIPDQSEDATLGIIDNTISTIANSILDMEAKIQCFEFFHDTLTNLGKKYKVSEVKLKTPIIEIENIDKTVAVSRKYATSVIRNIYLSLDNKQRKYYIEATNHIKLHYMDSNLSLKSVASHVGISHSYLSRIFSSIYNIHFTQALNDLRIEHSKELLADDKKLIRDISESVGFCTVQTFMRVFKQKTGITPSDYRLTLIDKNNK